MILNEFEYIQNIISKKEKRYYTKSEIIMLIKFYIKQNMNMQQVIDIINNFMFETNENYIPEKYIDFIEKEYKKILKRGYTLSEINKISLTDNEIKIVLSLSKLQHQKFLTAIMLFAKINKINRGNTFISFRELKTILSFANVSLTKKNQDDIITYFEELGFVKSDDDYNNLGIKVICLKDGNDEFEITEMEDIGKKIDKHIKLHYKGYKQCSECDKIFKPKSYNSNQKYCTDCAKKIANSQKNAYKKRKGEKRENQ